ncbi:MAG: hydrogenase expression/formation protein HypE [bacterium]|nr:hydrogenase expression/formation protein HypE [bacterium]
MERIVGSIADTATSIGVEVVTGDTKVVPRGQCDGMYINTAGIGSVPLGLGLSAERILPGDAILVTGTVGDHAIAILGARDGLRFESQILSDCAPLVDMVGAVLTSHRSVKWMRDPTRGGLAAVLDELAQDFECGLVVREGDVPVRRETRAVCDLLGFDPMHLANEGKAVMVVAQSDADAVLDTLRGTSDGAQAMKIGEITEDDRGVVRVQTALGGMRRLQRPSGELLPRIC